MEVVASLSQGHTAAAQCGLFTHKSVPVIFEPPCTYKCMIEYGGIQTVKTKNYSFNVPVGANCLQSFKRNFEHSNGL